MDVFLKSDFSKEQCSSLKMILGSKHVGAILNVLILKKCMYRVSIKSFSDYRHLLQENYVEYKHIFFTITQVNF